MNNRFYVSLEAEELLKEKGYQFVWGYDSIHPRKVTKSEAIDWLESKGIYIELMFNFEPSIIDHEVLWCYVVYNKIEGLGYKENYIFPTRLEAEEAAIIRALKETNKL